MRDKTFFCQFSRQFSVIYECISSCPFTNKKWKKLIPKISMVVECVDFILKKNQQLYFCIMYLNADSSYENKNGKKSKLLTSSVILFVTSIYHYPNSPCTS